MKASVFKLDETDQFGVIYYDITAKEDAIYALQELSSRKDKFITLLAHELRAHLVSILNDVELLTRKSVQNDEEDRAVLGMMQRQTTALVRLVDDLIDVFRINQGSLSFVKDRVEISDCIRSAIETVQPLIQNGKRDFRVSFTELPVFVLGDPTQLTRVFTNLLDRAIQFTSIGGLIEMRALSMDGEIIISVTNNGRGMPPEAFKKIFQMFEDVGHSASSAVGLSLVNKIVELHGGTVRAYSDGIEKGGTFFVSLPVALW